jgi:hypothetical protein
MAATPGLIALNAVSAASTGIQIGYDLWNSHKDKLTYRELEKEPNHQTGGYRDLANPGTYCPNSNCCEKCENCTMGFMNCIMGFMNWLCCCRCDCQDESGSCLQTNGRALSLASSAASLAALGLGAQLPFLQIATPIVPIVIGVGRVVGCGIGYCNRQRELGEDVVPGSTVSPDADDRSLESYSSTSI